MAETHTRRATLEQMAGSAHDLSVIFGSGPGGELLRMGHWAWQLNADGRGTLPELEPLPRSFSNRESRDHRMAEGMRATLPSSLFEAFMASRRAIERATTYPHELRHEGYSGQALQRKLTREGDLILPDLKTATEAAMKADDRVAEVRRTLGAETLTTEDEDGAFLAALGMSDPPAVREGTMPRAEAVATVTSAVQRSIFDAAVVQALQPLNPADRALLLDERALPKQIDDPRVVAAIFRAPAVLSPLKPDERAALARMAFKTNWPKVHAVTAAVDEMVRVSREVLGEAVYLTGGMLTDKPLDAFVRIGAQAGAWLLVPMAQRNAAAAQKLRELTMS